MNKAADGMTIPPLEGVGFPPLFVKTITKFHQLVEY
jgi:hypothetical protein